MFKKNILFFLFLILFLFLTYGLFNSYGLTYSTNMFLFIGTFVVSYILFNKYFLIKNKIEIPDFFSSKKLMFILDITILFVCVFQIMHYYFIGNIPVLKASFTSDYYYITEIRQDIKLVSSVVVNYGASFIIKSILPVMMLILFFKDKKRFWFYSFVAVFYCLALMQKAYIATLFIPLILKLLYLRKWASLTVVSSIVASGIVFLVLVTNPPLRPFSWKGQSTSSIDSLAIDSSLINSSSNPTAEVFSVLYERVFITTGKMVGNWFCYVPDSLPYLNGQGYRFVPPLIGGEYHDYSREIYDKIYLKEAAMGFTGTATTAFFMYDYANFGNYGLIIAGLYISIFLVFINRLFNKDFENVFALNGLFIIWLTSAAFTTTFFSGGWFLTLILYVVFKPLMVVNKEVLNVKENN